MSCTQIQCYSVPEIPCSAYNLIRFQCRQIDAVSRVPNCGGPLKVYIRGSLHSLCDPHSNYPNGQTELLIVQRIIILHNYDCLVPKKARRITHVSVLGWFWGSFEHGNGSTHDQTKRVQCLLLWKTPDTWSRTNLHFHCRLASTWEKQWRDAVESKHCMTGVFHTNKVV